MSRPAPLGVLTEAGGGAPLNGLADRCAAAAGGAPMAEELLRLFEEALGGERVEGMGLLGGGEKEEKKEGKVANLRPPRPSKRVRTENDSVGAVDAESKEEGGPKIGHSSATKKPRKGSAGANEVTEAMSKGETEDVLSKVKNEVENEKNDEIEWSAEEGAEATDKATQDNSHSCRTEGGEISGEEAGGTVDRKEKCEENIYQPLSSLGWTLCQSWDACAIGTLPAYPA
mmetsp:Transcript_40097/g.120886  ORF Transcript_40097/g.120886 Transcript_40097/m.120886 type:complete len:229 (-) Transcript_40097:280-966(-)